VKASHKFRLFYKINTRDVVVAFSSVPITTQQHTNRDTFIDFSLCNATYKHTMSNLTLQWYEAERIVYKVPRHWPGANLCVFLIVHFSPGSRRPE